MECRAGALTDRQRQLIMARTKGEIDPRSGDDGKIRTAGDWAQSKSEPPSELKTPVDLTG
jgi:hypothetical protein